MHRDDAGARSRPRLPKFERRYVAAVVGDLAVLRDIDPELVGWALAAIEDLAFGRQRGKLLAERHVTGDLTGLCRLRFDLPGTRSARFRIVYRFVDDDTAIEVLAIGERADHVVYRDTLIRLNASDDHPASD